MGQPQSAVAIVGGGIVGASVAYHLSQHSAANVTVYERSTLASETTAASGAFVGFWGDEAPSYRHLKHYGIRLYNDFFTGSRATHSYKLSPRLTLASTTGMVQELQAAVATRAAVCGKSEYLSGKQLDASLLHPGLDTSEVEAAVYRSNLGYLEPTKLATEFIERARENGVTFETQAEVEDVTTDNDAVTGVVVNGTHQTFDAVVAAAGPWNRQVAQYVGLELPVRQTLAPVLILEPPEPIQYDTYSIKHLESGIYFRQQPDGTVFVGHYPGGYDDAGGQINPDEAPTQVSTDRREQMQRIVETYFPWTENAHIADEWVGVRSLTPDAGAIAGWTEVDGFYVTGFNAAGIQLAPVIGHVVAEQLLHNNPTTYYNAVRLSRFEGHGEVFSK